MSKKKVLILSLATIILLVCGMLTVENSSRDMRGRERLSSEFVDSLFGSEIGTAPDEETQKKKSELTHKYTWLALDLEAVEEKYALNPSDELAEEIDRIKKELYDIEQELAELGFVMMTDEEVKAMFEEIERNHNE